MADFGEWVCPIGVADFGEWVCPIGVADFVAGVSSRCG